MKSKKPIPQRMNEKLNNSLLSFSLGKKRNKMFGLPK